MSQLLINQFLNELDRLRTISGTNRETVVREAFKDLLKNWAKSHDLVFIPEYEIITPAKERRLVDGALLYSLRVPFGYWEAKDEKDDLDEEIATKFRRGYPQTNIIFEDSRTAVLIQDRREVARCSVEDTKALERLLDLYFAYERPEIAEFRKAVEQFKTDLPAVLNALREKIEASAVSNSAFRAEELKFLQHAQETINPAVTPADVREMLIQHILTEEIFSKVYDDDQFHRENNIAKELYALEAKFFTGSAKKQTLKQLEPYYAAIRSAAAQISSHSEKQTFLKVIYENFYKVYNPKAADRLGVIYTPNEIVRFMIESADWLCEKHFGKSLIDSGVEILDPATGTGTFICELLEHFRGQKKKLEYKYREELHANEVAILPYYVANLNIEATYAAMSGQYAEFRNLCFVDTLDNVAGLGKFSGHQEDLFGAMSEENVERIKRQNKRKISVIIGNPPYNANQQNENDNNKNRAYERIDQRIKDTYIKESMAQKTKLYDMYTRFFRWATDRLKEDGIIAFITNRSFIERRSFDGFRKCIEHEFESAYFIDLGGDIRELSGKDGIFLNEDHTIFGTSAAVGIAISFLIKKQKLAQEPCSINYLHPCDIRATREDKFAYLRTTPISNISFDKIRTDTNGNWINQAANDFETFSPVATKSVKAGKLGSGDRSIFKLFSLGISTNRDEWVYDFSEATLVKKVRELSSVYHAQRIGAAFAPRIKWSRNLKRRLEQGRKEPFSSDRILRAAYRPFTEKYLYDSQLFIDENGARSAMFPAGAKNISICFSDAGFRSSFCVLAVNGPADLHFGASVDAYQQLPLNRFVGTDRLDNVTDWALGQFETRYQLVGAILSPAKGGEARHITKDAIFHYVYAVLHDPIYREKYALNLKREFPRIPFYNDFWRWADWGEALMQLHLGYEQVKPWKLKRTDVRDEKSEKAGLLPKPILKADQEHGIIVLDSETQLSGVPKEAWDYHLGNRTALEWILDQYKEKTPKDPTIREEFNTYRFADYKEKVIDLLCHVTRVSFETQAIVEEMRKVAR